MQYITIVPHFWQRKIKSSVIRDWVSSSEGCEFESQHNQPDTKNKELNRLCSRGPNLIMADSVLWLQLLNKLDMQRNESHCTYISMVFSLILVLSYCLCSFTSFPMAMLVSSVFFSQKRAVQKHASGWIGYTNFHHWCEWVFECHCMVPSRRLVSHSLCFPALSLDLLG